MPEKRLHTPPEWLSKQPSLANEKCKEKNVKKHAEQIDTYMHGSSELLYK